MDGVRAVPDGQYTTTIYTAIKEGRYTDAVQVLEFERQTFPRSRAALSLLGETGNAVTHARIILLYAAVQP